MDETQRQTWKQRLLSERATDVVEALHEMERSGDRDCLELLKIAGQNLHPDARKPIFVEPDGNNSVNDYVERCRAALTGSVAASRPAAAGRPRVFLSYSHENEERARRLAAEFSESAELFLDQWRMGAGDVILERIEAEVSSADWVVVLLSKSSVSSDWVKVEIEQAFRRQHEEKRRFLIPVVIEDCELPVGLKDRAYFDWRQEDELPKIVQCLLDEFRGSPSFSGRIDRLLAENDSSSPYEESYRAEGQELLELLPAYPQLDLDSNQRCLVWELMHRILPRYHCKMLVEQEGDRFVFELTNYWMQKGSKITLTQSELERGLWGGRWNLLHTQRLHSTALTYQWDRGRLSLQGSCSPRVDRNPAPKKAELTVSPVIKTLEELWRPFSEHARSSFLYDLQYLLLPKDWHSVEVVAGSFVANGERRVVFEIFDPFLGALKAVELSLTDAEQGWETDVDLFQPRSQLW